MKFVFSSLFRQFLFWILFFSVVRIIFVIVHFSLFKDTDSQILSAFFYYNIWLDISAISYILAFPVLILLFQIFVRKKWIDNVALIYNYVMIAVVSLIAVSEIGVFAEWKTKLTYKAIAYLAHPFEIINSAGNSNFFFLLIVLIALIAGSVLFFKRFVHEKFSDIRIKFHFKIAIVFLLPFFIFLGLRGGIRQIPINQSQSYFSLNNNLNLLSVNPFWNFFQSVFQNYASWSQNPFIFYNPDEAKDTVIKMHKVSADTTVSIFTSKKPNIVMVILEGWSADLIEALGAKPGITPRFDTLVKKGLLFTNIFSPGSRSEQGMTSIFSAFPAQPLTAIAHMPDKFVKLPSFPAILSKSGYNSSFCFGGQLIYGNMKSYIYFNKFNKIIEGDDFSSDIPRGKLGVHDEFLYPRVLSEICNDKEPFFYSLFTMSSHSPYDWPNKKEILRYGDPERDYINAAYYADSCLASFLLSCSKQKWYDNTIFILVADHGHGSYISRNVYDPGYQHIPLLLYGNALKPEFKGKQDSAIGSQVDIAATLLKQLGYNTSSFHWSKDLLNPYAPHYAFISYEVGFTWVCKDGYFVYDHNLKKVLVNTISVDKQDSIVKAGKSYLQQLYQEYWDF